MADVTTNIEATIRANIIQATKNHDDVAKEVLRVVLGEIQLLPGTPTDEQRIVAIRKVLKGIITTLESASERPELVSQLRREKEVLDSLLKEFAPPTISRDEIITIISEKGIKIDSNVPEGRAMGMIMKELKVTGKAIDSTMVKEIVVELRK